MVSGLSQAASYDAAKGVFPGKVRSYWDSFGIGLAIAIAFIVIGSLWAVLAGLRARRAEAQ
jgi:Na+-translocating ferredoxin:NAD+ oxidoreductase RnfE subunit